MAATSALSSTSLLTIESLDQEGRGVARVDARHAGGGEAAEAEPLADAERDHRLRDAST
jgi:hypothetical protein